MDSDTEDRAGMPGDRDRSQGELQGGDRLNLRACPGPTFPTEQLRL